MRISALMSLFLFAGLGIAAPALTEKPPRWEYAELTYRNNPGRPAGADADGNEVPAVSASMTIRWVTKEGEIVAKGWVELAEKLKAPGYKKDGSAAFQRIQFLNYLGSEGWELIEQPGGTPPLPAIDRGDRGASGRGVTDRFGRLPSATTSLMFKRRLP